MKKLFLAIVPMVLVLASCSVGLGEAISGDDSVSARVEALETEVQTLQTEKETLIVEYKTVISDKKAAVISSKAALQSALEDYLNATDKLTEAQKEEIEALESQISELEADLDEEVSNYEKLLGENTELKAEVAALEADNSTLTEQVSNLNKEIDALNEELNNLEASNTSNINELETKLETQKEMLASISTLLNEYESILGGSGNIIDWLKSKITTSKDSKAYEKLQEVINQLELAQKQLESVSSEIKTTESISTPSCVDVLQHSDTYTRLVLDESNTSITLNVDYDSAKGEYGYNILLYKNGSNLNPYITSTNHTITLSGEGIYRIYANVVSIQ